MFRTPFTTAPRKTEQELGITIDVVKTDMWDTTGDMQKHVMANEDVYNAACMPLKNAMTQSEYVMNLYDIDTLHLSDEWWKPELHRSGDHARRQALLYG